MLQIFSSCSGLVFVFFVVLYNLPSLAHGQKVHHQFYSGYNITLESSRWIIICYQYSSCFQNRARSLGLLFPGSFLIMCSQRHLFSPFPCLAVDNCSEECFFPDPQFQSPANLFRNTISAALPSKMKFHC